MLLKLKSIIDDFQSKIKNENREIDEKSHIQESLDYFYHKKDPKDNGLTTLPEDERVKVPAIWAFEVFTPEYVDHFYQSLEKLGWLDDMISPEHYLEERLDTLRYRVDGGSALINIGFVIDYSAKQTIPSSKQAHLPKGVNSIHISLLRPMASTTILICQFEFSDDLSYILEETFTKSFQTYIQKHKHSTQFIDVISQKKKSVQLNLEYLKSICSEWLKEHFRGVYASDLIKEEHPICTFLTLEKNIPFTKMDNYTNYLSILDLYHNSEVWTNDTLTGLYLKFYEDRDTMRDNLLLTGNIHEMLKNKDLSIYHEKNESNYLHYLHYLDYTLGAWILNVLLDSYIYKINDLRDEYGKANIDNLEKSISTITALDYEVLKVQKNIVPFISELKHYSETPCFMHNLFEFTPYNQELRKERTLFSSIQKNIIYKVDLLSKQEKILQNTANAVRQMNSIIFSDKLANTNVQMQSSIKFMTKVIVALTIISTISAIVSIFK